MPTKKEAQGQWDSATTPAGKKVEDTLQEENEQGFRGIEVDQTPNLHYTVAGVTQGLPTPETDYDSHVKAHAELHASRFPKKKGGDQS